MQGHDSGLFGADLPPGFEYRTGFISIEEEAALVREISRLAFAAFEMRGVVAKRRVAFFGRSYDNNTVASPPIPAFLLPYRTRLAAWLGVEPDALAMALINEYREGAPIGWHRDAPQYDVVAGISLLSACRMKLRPYVTPKALASAKPAARRIATHEITLEPRSAYLMSGQARAAYEHHIPPAAALRYSVTFRTLRTTTRASTASAPR
jgi:alkylated DNA repair dioxygenase AlkB